MELVNKQQSASLKDILLQDLEEHTNEGLQPRQEYAIIVDKIALMNTVLNKSSNAEFAKLYVKRIPYVCGRVDIMADCFKTMLIKNSEQLSIRGDQSEKIHIVSFLSRVLSDFHSSILRNSDTKTTENAYLNISKEKQNIV